MHVEAVIWTRRQKAEYAFANFEGIVEAKALLLGTSAQKTELIVLTRALDCYTKRG